MLAIWPGLGATQDVPAEVMRELARDLAELQNLIQKESRAVQAREKVGKAAYVVAYTPGWVGSGIAAVETTEKAKFYSGASKLAKVLWTDEKGAAFPLVDKAGGWYAVSRGDQIGWVNAAVAAPIAPTLKNRDRLIELGKRQRVLYGEVAEKPERDEGVRTTNASIYELLLERARKFRESYATNPYLRVAGFSVSISVPPALELSFAFVENEK